MDIQKMTEVLEEKSQDYSKKFDIIRDSDWYILKLQEELGELVQSYLMMIGQARNKNKTKNEINANFKSEIADVFSHILLLAKYHNIDVEKEVKEKWLT